MLTFASRDNYQKTKTCLDNVQPVPQSKIDDRNYESAVPIRNETIDIAPKAGTPSISKKLERLSRRTYKSAVPTRDGFSFNGPAPRDVSVKIPPVSKEAQLASIAASLTKMTEKTLPDPSDVKWLTERQRRLDAGESLESIIISPPFGRPQRVLPVPTSATLGLTRAELVAEIAQIKALMRRGVEATEDLVGTEEEEE